MRRDRDPAALRRIQEDDGPILSPAPVIVHHVINDRQSFSISYTRIIRMEKKGKEKEETHSPLASH